MGLQSDEDCVVALRMANDRNLAAHVYDEKLAEALNSRIDNHAAVLARWLGACRTRLGKQTAAGHEIKLIPRYRVGPRREQPGIGMTVGR